MDSIEWTRFDAPKEECFLIGFTYLFLAVFFLFLQFSTLRIFLFYNEYYRNACYRCMIIISIADVIQLIIHCYGGLITIFNDSFNKYLEKILGGLCNSICITLLPLSAVLAFNRLIILFGSSLINRHMKTKLFDFLIGLSCLCGLIFFMFYISPYSGIVFRNYAWGYDMSLPWSKTIQLVDEFLTIPMLLFPLLFYFISLLILIAKRRNQNLSKKRHLILAPHELRLLIQSVVFFSCEVTLLVLWHLQGHVFSTTPYTTAGLNYLWILYNGINPLLYLALNKTIRRRMIFFWKNKKLGQISVYTPNSVCSKVRTDYNVN